MVNPSATPRARPRTWADLPKVDPAVHLAALIVMCLDPFINFKLREYFWYIVWNFVLPELSEDIPYFSFTPQFPLWNAQFDDLHDDDHMDHLDEFPVEKDLEKEDEKDPVELKLDEHEHGDLEEVDDEESDDDELDQEVDDEVKVDDEAEANTIMVDDEDSDVDESSETDPLNITSTRTRDYLVATLTVSVTTTNNIGPRGVKRRRLYSPEADDGIPVASPIPEASPEARASMYEVFSSDLPDSDEPPDIDPKKDSPDAQSLLRHFLTDFAGVFKPPETLPWIPVIVEIKRRTRQNTASLSEGGKEKDLSKANSIYLSSACSQAENQANYLFRGYPHQPKVLAIAGVGDIWTWRMCVRGDPSDIARKEASRDHADCPSDANFPSTDSRHITSSQSEMKESEWSDLYVLQTEASDDQLQEVKEEVRTLINTFLELIDGIDPEEGEGDSEEEDGDDDDDDSNDSK
ncbi:hypothetical protein C8J56DRAFT_962552 [Mycena floridula]|nr:hypothetical protein C8J56DRAFT_962552 [Mycena floridula]